ncbi:MAG: hypothetical protein ACREJT_16290, partial [Myxococcota bacterium]
MGALGKRDDRERHDRRPYFYVADSIANEPWTNDQLALVIRLQAKMHERWRTDRLSEEQASTIVLSTGELQHLAGVRSGRWARARLQYLPLLVTCKIVVLGEYHQIEWPKFAEFQWGQRRSAGDPLAKRRPPKQKQKQKQNTEEETPLPPSPKAGRIECPERLPDAARERVIAWAKSNYPERLSELPTIWQRVRAWGESKSVRRT